MLLIRTILFTLLVPGFVAGVAPILLADAFPAGFDPHWWQVAGVAAVVTGVTLYPLSVMAFFREGKGTPALSFTRPLRRIIGEEPGTLVVGRLYRFSRNPMYLGVLLIVLGSGILAGKWVILGYFILLCIFFHCVVVWIEEPHLRKKYGLSYDAYLKSVPRWFRLCSVNTMKR